MATYKEIKGVTVQTRDEDPTVNAGSWSSGGSLNTARKDLGSFGDGANNGIAVGGYGGGSANAGNYVESYNGTSWAETTEVNAGRGWSPAGAGTQTAGVITGGQPLPPGSGYIGITEEWDGSSWSESGDLNIARAYANMTGTQTAAVAFGGNNPSPTASRTDTENYNGTSWTEANNMNTARDDNSLSGRGAPYTSVISVFGTSTEIWDGTNWTETSEANTGRKSGSGAGASSSSAVIYGGYTSPPTTYYTRTESWNGTAWTEVNDLSAARGAGGTTGGTSQNAMYFGGEPPSYTAATEEWSFPAGPHLNEGDLFLSGGATLKGFGRAAGIPAATFASGSNLNTARGYHGGSGTDHEALLAFGGTTGTAVNNVEQYNGSSWSEVAEINTTRANLTGFGSSTAAIGGNGSTPDKSQVESWNGSAWTEIAELNTSRSDSASAGVQTSGMVATGTPVPGNPALQPGGTSYVTETWNGSAWTEVGDTNTKRLQAGMAMGGSVTAGIIASGEDGPGSRTVNAETWDGSSWTEVGNLSNARGTLYNFMGHSTSANAAGGYSGTARLATNEHWNGSSWTEINDLSTARNAAFGAGSAVNGAVFGGDTGDYQSATEEFIADNTLSTVTVS